MDIWNEGTETQGMLPVVQDLAAVVCMPSANLAFIREVLIRADAESNDIAAVCQFCIDVDAHRDFRIGVGTEEISAKGVDAGFVGIIVFRIHGNLKALFKVAGKEEDCLAGHQVEIKLTAVLFAGNLSAIGGARIHFTNRNAGIECIGTGSRCRKAERGLLSPRREAGVFIKSEFIDTGTRCLNRPMNIFFQYGDFIVHADICAVIIIHMWNEFIHHAVESVIQGNGMDVSAISRILGIPIPCIAQEIPIGCLKVGIVMTEGDAGLIAELRGFFRDAVGHGDDFSGSVEFLIMRVIHCRGDAVFSGNSNFFNAVSHRSIFIVEPGAEVDRSILRESVSEYIIVMRFPGKIREIGSLQFAVPVAFDGDAVPYVCLWVELQDLAAVDHDSVSKFRKPCAIVHSDRAAAVLRAQIDILGFVCCAEEANGICIRRTIICTCTPGPICVAHFHKIHPSRGDGIHAGGFRGECEHGTVAVDRFLKILCKRGYIGTLCRKAAERAEQPELKLIGHLITLFDMCLVPVLGIGHQLFAAEPADSAGICRLGEAETTCIRIGNTGFKPALFTSRKFFAGNSNRHIVYAYAVVGAVLHRCAVPDREVNTGNVDIIFRETDGFNAVAGGRIDNFCPNIHIALVSVIVRDEVDNFILFKIKCFGAVFTVFIIYIISGFILYGSVEPAVEFRMINADLIPVGSGGGELHRLAVGNINSILYPHMNICHCTCRDAADDLQA